MSLPKVITQIVITGGQILGKAFLEAGRQAVKNAKAAPASAVGSDVAGVRNATSGSSTDKLTRDHRMTLDEAHLILNTKPGTTLETVKSHYGHLFKVNAPAPPSATKAPKPKAGGKQVVLPIHSHYLQSKVVRALERIEAEMKVMAEDTHPTAPENPAETPGSATSTPPPEGGVGGKSS